MVLDSSAVVSVLLGGPGADGLTGTLRAAHAIRMSAATLVEASIVMAGYHGRPGIVEVDGLLFEFGVDVYEVTSIHAATAREAYLRFGKGYHPAALNFGDCFSYALATRLDEPLLFVGGDFSKTDVRVA